MRVSVEPPVDKIGLGACSHPSEGAVVIALKRDKKSCLTPISSPDSAC